MSHDPMIQIPIEDVMGERFGRYSKYIIQERALPDLRDGLKPVQRRILYAMFKEGNIYNKAYRKSAKTVGLVIGNYHPHGDSSVYDAMVRLSQDWKMNMPLVDMQGNNGSIDDDPAAAMRYTEARLTKLSQKLLENIDEEVVPFVLNFDDTTTEPSVLPAQFPNLLVNGSTGIAAGYATNIPPFNLGEILNAVIYRISDPSALEEDILSLIQGPDFPTGAIIQGHEGIQEILRTGRGRVVVRAKTEIISKKTLQQIIITELPYEVIKANLVRKIDDLRFSKANEGFGDVLDVRDESDRKGMKIVIDCRKDADVQSILNLFYKHTELQVYYNANMVAIVEKQPKRLGVLAIIDAYISFRKDIVLKRTQYRLAQKEKRLHIIEGLIKAMSILDEIIMTIRQSDNRSNARDNLMNSYGFTYIQASAILDLQLYRLSSTDIVELRTEFAKLLKEVESLNQIINNEAILNNLLIQEFYELKEDLEIERRSQIEHEISDLEVDHMNLIPDEPVMLSLSRKGYIKKVSMRSYASSQKEQIALMEEDKPLLIGEVLTKDTLVFMTSKGRYASMLVHDIEEARWKDVGSHMNQYMKLAADETIIAAFMIRDFNTYQFIVTVSSKGFIKKTGLELMEGKRNNRLFDIMTLDKDEEMIGAYVCFANDDLLLVSHNGMLMRMSLKDVRPIGLKAKGIIGMKLKAHDFVDSSAVWEQKSELVLVSKKGQMKRLKLQDIPVMNRATQGISSTKTVKSNPHYLAKLLTADIYDRLLIYDGTELKELVVKDIPLMPLDATFSTVLTGPVYVIDPLKRVEKYERILDNQETNDQENLQFDLS